ncbi:MAG: pseudouridylate synthase [Bdellovibrionaceae bacterium]|nr:pseudouridylate synthase [Pseudobdellovibrionaceae bacterium]|tara:strand:- start:15740 stop:16726 length:987 start_codon:yes stop_codon:yes gene_type:complete
MQSQKIVSEENEGIRLDQFLCLFDEVPSRSHAAKLIENGDVQVLEITKKLKASTKLSAGQKVVVNTPKRLPSVLSKWDYPLEIYFEDEDLIVLNKESGMVVHPSPGHPDKTLVNALLNHSDCFQMGMNEERPGIVHRIDKETSGLLVVAKNPETHQKLTELFKNRDIERNYWAVCAGVPKQLSGSIESEIGRHPVNRKKMSSQSRQGKYAKTDYKILANFNKLSLVKFKLHTGRTHQIRVHCSEKHFPIICDELYSSMSGLKSFLSQKQIADLKKLNRFFLHAAVLGFKHPRTGEKLAFYSPIPKDLQTWIDHFGFVEYLQQENFINA